MFDIGLERDFDFLSAQYRRLFQRSRATAFQHPLWLDGLYRTLAPVQGAEPLVVVARERCDGELALVLPLLRRRRHGLRMVEFADLGVTDYASAVCDDDAFAALAEDPQARQKIQDLLKPFDLLRIKKAPESAQPLERLFAGARRRPLGVSTHAAALSTSFPDWQAEKMPPSFAKELRKKRRQLERQGVVAFDQLYEPSEIISLMRDLQTFRGRRFPGDILGQDAYLKFYTDMALVGAGNGMARVYRLSLDGRVLGGVFGLSHRRQFLLLISAFDYPSYPRQSLGALAFQEVARACIERQDDVLDFTLGDEDYKRSFGAEPSPLSTVSAYGSGLGMIADRITSHRAPPERGMRTPFPPPAEAVDAA